MNYGMLILTPEPAEKAAFSAGSLNNKEGQVWCLQLWRPIFKAGNAGTVGTVYSDWSILVCNIDICHTS